MRYAGFHFVVIAIDTGVASKLQKYIFFDSFSGRKQIRIKPNVNIVGPYSKLPPRRYPFSYFVPYFVNQAKRGACTPLSPLAMHKKEGKKERKNNNKKHSQIQLHLKGMAPLVRNTW